MIGFSVKVAIAITGITLSLQLCTMAQTPYSPPPQEPPVSTVGARGH